MNRKGQVVYRSLVCSVMCFTSVCTCVTDTKIEVQLLSSTCHRPPAPARLSVCTRLCIFWFLSPSISVVCPWNFMWVEAGSVNSSLSALFPPYMVSVTPTHVDVWVTSSLFINRKAPCIFISEREVVRKQIGSTGLRCESKVTKWVNPRFLVVEINTPSGRVPLAPWVCNTLFPLLLDS